MMGFQCNIYFSETIWDHSLNSGIQDQYNQYSDMMSLPMGKNTIVLSQTRAALWPQILWSSQKPHWIGTFPGSLWVPLKPGIWWNSRSLREKLCKGKSIIRVLFFPVHLPQRYPNGPYPYTAHYLVPKMSPGGLWYLQGRVKNCSTESGMSGIRNKN